MSNYPARYLAEAHPFKFLTLRQAKKNGQLSEYLIWLLQK